MPVVLFHHPGIPVPQVLSQDYQRHARHDRQAGVGVPQDVEADRRINAGVFASVFQGPLVEVVRPGLAVFG